MTPRGDPNKTAPAAVLHGLMFSKSCALAHKRVPCTRAAAQAAALRLLCHISKLSLRVPLVFTKKHGIDAAKLMLRLRPAFVNRTYYTITPRSGLNKTASAAVLHGSMFSKLCAPAQGVCRAHARPRKRQFWGHYTVFARRMQTEKACARCHSRAAQAFLLYFCLNSFASR